MAPWVRFNLGALISAHVLLNSWDCCPLPHPGCPLLAHAFAHCMSPWLGPIGCSVDTEKWLSRPFPGHTCPPGLSLMEAAHLLFGGQSSSRGFQARQGGMVRRMGLQSQLSASQLPLCKPDAEASHHHMHVGGKARTQSKVHGPRPLPFFYISCKLCKPALF